MCCSITPPPQVDTVRLWQAADIRQTFISAEERDPPSTYLYPGTFYFHSDRLIRKTGPNNFVNISRYFISEKYHIPYFNLFAILSIQTSG